jgi:hypothetical protein
MKGFHMKALTKHRRTRPRVEVIAPNHTVISTDYGRYLTSYDSVIVFVPKDEPTLYLGEDWNYSSTTSKYRNRFLSRTTADIQRMLRDGTAKIVEM